MAIKRSDGTVYKLQGPNILMEAQKFWKDYILHNFKLGNFIDSKDHIITQKVIPPEVEAFIDPPEAFLPELPVKIEIPIIPEIKTPEPKKLNISTTKIHCLPAEIKSKTDDLYGETYEKTVYKDKILIEGVLLERTEYNLSFWSNHKLSKNSIVYPSNKDRTWWKINNIEEKTGGFIYACEYSDIHPDFSA
jgi:hypothetical protein